MSKKLRELLPIGLRRVSRRVIVRLVRSIIHLTKDVLNIATTNGLDLEREWNRKQTLRWMTEPETNVKPEISPSWSIRDFLFLTELMRNGQGKTEESSNNPIQCSIIIPVFNNAAFTFQCLRSLFYDMAQDTEIIVINNGSIDETAQLLSYMKPRVRVLDNHENLGFVRACNQGAAVAQGRYLVFLNNDTTVQPGWLKRLVETVEADVTVGAVGSMLVYPDGRLQEAGGIIWKDGNGANYGRGQNPEDRKYRFAREVDYCSAASLLVRKDLFQKLRGFDERYTPAFYEDTDLCFGIRSLGYKVVYQPMSQVIHYEGATAGSDVRRGYKRYQEVNRSKFVEKWRQVLELEQFEQNTANLDLAADRQRGPRIIVFDHGVPTPDRDSGSVRMLEILRSITRFARPLFVPVHLAYPSRYEDMLGKEGIEVVAPDSYQRLIKSRDFQIAILSRAEVADEVLNSIRKLDPNIKIIFDTVDLHFFRLDREYEHSKDDRFAREAADLKLKETRLAAASDQVWCVSHEDKEILEREVPAANIQIIPNIHAEYERVAGFNQRDGLLFIGNFDHRPNRDALDFYLKEILPLLRELLPLPQLKVVGSNMPEEIFDYASEEVCILGYVPDLTPLLQSARLMIAPLRFGAGMKGKIGQALSHGLPVVTTSIGNEGFGLSHRREIMLGDDPTSFARAVFEAYSDMELWVSLSENGRRYISENLSPPVVRKKLYEALRRLINLEPGAGSAGLRTSFEGKMLNPGIGSSNSSS